MIRSIPIVILALSLLSPALAQDGAQERIQYLAEHVLLGSGVDVDDATLASAGIIPEFYARREFTPAWESDKQVDEFIDLIGRAYEEGLDPDDYLHEELQAIRQQHRANRDDGNLRGDFDVLLTESLARYGYHLIYGKVDPADLDDNWNWTRSADGRDPADLIEQALDSDSIKNFISSYLERGPVYVHVRDMLARYRALSADGGWPQVSPGPTLKPGMEDDRISVIRERLAISGDLQQAADNGSNRFDEVVEQGVVRFQQRHNLDTDGAIGKQTVAAMNVTAEERVDQIRVNLERLRWVVRDLDDEFVITNIAAFRTLLVRDREVLWSARSQVGRFFRQTPVFRAEIKYLQFNPTWTVPPGILTKDILPAVQKDIGYLASKNMDLVDRDGGKVDPATVDWSSYGPGRLPPFQFVQRPGPTNALGRVKFIFPNPHFVFLHDTPSKALFERTERAFSSGCIRVEQPFELAELLLDNPAKWNQTSIQALLDSEEPQTVFLREPLTVMLLYATVGITDPETDRFYNDIYERDARVLVSLNNDFEFKLPEDSPAHLNR
jgi:murein L,D-transpeptidase YcbB/YkuD